MHFYRAYEINFASAIELPDIMPQAQVPSRPDVTIRIGKTPSCLVAQKDDSAWFQSSKQQTLIKIEDIANYLISNGNSIIVEPAGNADPDMVRLFLLGSATGALLYQRGLLPLHGSAVETPGGAMAFIGPQGIGKSTLVAHFKQRGYRILSDDICVIAPGTQGILEVLPAFPKLRLCSDALERLGRSTDNLRRARFDGDKFVVPVAGRHCPHPVILGAIHLLSAGTDADIMTRTFHGFGRADCLLSNLYRAEYLQGLESEIRIYNLAMSIASHARLVEVVHNRDPDRIEELVDRLEGEWQLQSLTRRNESHGDVTD
jgi:hypothetical protein